MKCGFQKAEEHMGEEISSLLHRAEQLECRERKELEPPGERAKKVEMAGAAGPERHSRPPGFSSTRALAVRVRHFARYKPEQRHKGNLNLLVVSGQ
ncbi:hypothetical protein MHYP_G00291660 [Metynnis hypsauchen]